MGAFYLKCPVLSIIDMMQIGNRKGDPVQKNIGELIRKVLDCGRICLLLLENKTTPGFLSIKFDKLPILEKTKQFSLVFL